MAIDFAALKTECTGDPSALGLSTPFSAGAFSTVTGLLNAVLQSIDIDRDLVESWMVFDACAPAEVEALNAVKRQLLQILLACRSST